MVVFPRSPPLNPPTIEQIFQRQAFVAAAAEWRLQGPETRAKWKRAARRAALKITGYNLWVYWRCTNDQETIRTIERQSGINLLGN